MPKTKKENNNSPQRPGPYDRPSRNRSSPKLFGNFATDEDLEDADPGINTLIVDERSNDDFDWLPSVPGRPAPHSNTWTLVYGDRTPNEKITGFIIQCGEGCKKDIQLNSLRQEIDGGSTPHGKLRKPPVCHSVPWAALEVSLINEEFLMGKKLTADFRRAVCWEITNLHPGHNACNAAGTKTTAQNVTPKELSDAKHVIETVSNARGGRAWEK